MGAQQYTISRPKDRQLTSIRRGGMMRMYVDSEKDKQQRIMSDLKEANIGWYGMLMPEAKMLVGLLHDYEQISGGVYGYSPQGFALFIATDRRVLIVSKKFVTTQVDEVPFSSIQGVTLDMSIFLATVTLHTKIGNFPIQTINFACATKFVEYIELMIEEKIERLQEVYI